MFRAILMVIVVGAVPSAVVAADDVLKLVRTIPLDQVEGRIDHMSISADGRHLFVAALGNNSVEIVDAEAGSLAGSIGKIKEPQGVRFIDDSKRLAVASGGDDNLRVYDDGLSLVGTVNDLPDADNVRYDADAKLLYVGYGNGALAVIDPDKVVKLADIKLEGHPESFQLEAKGKRIFVNVPSANQIAVIDREKKSVITTWPVPDAHANFPMALDEDHHRLFIGCRRPAKLLVLDTETGKSVARLDCAGDSDDVFYDSAGNQIYVSGGEGVITVIGQSGADSYKLLANVKTAAGARTSFFSTRNRTLFLAVPHRGAQKAEVRAYQPTNGK